MQPGRNQDPNVSTLDPPGFQAMQQRWERDRVRSRPRDVAYGNGRTALASGKIDKRRSGRWRVQCRLNRPNLVRLGRERRTLQHLVFEAIRQIDRETFAAKGKVNAHSS